MPVNWDLTRKDEDAFVRVLTPLSQPHSFWTAVCSQNAAVSTDLHIQRVVPRTGSGSAMMEARQVSVVMCFLRILLSAIAGKARLWRAIAGDW